MTAGTDTSLRRTTRTLALVGVGMVALAACASPSSGDLHRLPSSSPRTRTRTSTPTSTVPRATPTAPPGHSEHQTGLAVDISAIPPICSLDACFAQTPHGQWLAANAWRFGFVLRYPADKVAVTGFTFEPWHFRYIGVPLATEMHISGVKTLEEFFGLAGGTKYR
jgi:hypothetical protein